MRAMKKAILIAVTVRAFTRPPLRIAEDPRVPLELIGSSGPYSMVIDLSPDGRTYVLQSSGALDVGNSICWHAAGNAVRAALQGAAIAGFEVKGEAGDDVVEVGGTVQFR